MPAMVTVPDAPVFATRDATRSPIRVLALNTTVRLVNCCGEWVRILFQDPEYGNRFAYIQAEYLRPREERPVASGSTVTLAVPATQPTAKPNTDRASATAFCRDQALVRLKYQKTLDWVDRANAEGDGVWLVSAYVMRGRQLANA